MGECCGMASINHYSCTVSLLLLLLLLPEYHPITHFVIALKFSDDRLMLLVNINQLSASF